LTHFTHDAISTVFILHILTITLPLKKEICSHVPAKKGSRLPVYVIGHLDELLLLLTSIFIRRVLAMVKSYDKTSFFGCLCMLGSRRRHDPSMHKHPKKELPVM